MVARARRARELTNMGKPRARVLIEGKEERFSLHSQANEK